MTKEIRYAIADSSLMSPYNDSSLSSHVIPINIITNKQTHICKDTKMSSKMLRSKF